VECGCPRRFWERSKVEHSAALQDAAA